MVLVDSSAVPEDAPEDADDEDCLPVLRRVVLRLHPGLSELVIHATADSIPDTTADVPALALALDEVSEVACGRVSAGLAKAAQLAGDGTLSDRVFSLQLVAPAAPNECVWWVWARACATFTRERRVLTRKCGRASCARRANALPLEFIAADHDERHAWVVALAFVHSVFPVSGALA